MEQVAANMLL